MLKHRLASLVHILLSAVMLVRPMAAANVVNKFEAALSDMLQEISQGQVV